MLNTYETLKDKDHLLKARGKLEKGANRAYKPLNYDKMKGIWISQFDFKAVYCDGEKQRAEESYRELLGAALDNVVTLGFNTVIVQMRPNADSFYPSEYYPWSHFINGQYGKFGEYDPIKIFIDEAHKRKLSFQAWINPMRGMPVEDAEKLDTAYPMARWMKDPECKRYLYVGDYANKKAYYLNVYYEEVRQLIIDGASEIVRYYDVDGVHMDDYFYPGNDEGMDDIEFAIEKEKKSDYTLKEMRYESLSKLVSGIYSAVKAENPNVLYGIAPAGNLNNVRKNYYADVDTWCGKEGYIDYIMPQIYWGFEHPICPFAETYEQWFELCCKSVKFMVGLTFANAIYGYDGVHYEEFKNSKAVYRKTFEYMESKKTFKGFSMFCYQYYFDALTNMANVKTSEEVMNSITAMRKISSKKIRNKK